MFVIIRIASILMLKNKLKENLHGKSWTCSSDGKGNVILEFISGLKLNHVNVRRATKCKK